MRANAVTIGFLVLGVSAVSACLNSASAQLRSKASLAAIIRVPFRTPTCLPIESHDGRRQNLSALVARKLVVIWVSDIVMPTQPPQFILIGIEVYDAVPTHR